MSTAPQPAKELTMLELLAFQAATTAELNSFASAYDANPVQAARGVAGFAKTNSPLIHVTNLCNTNLVKQLVSIKPNYKISILTCPFVTMNAEGEEVIVGSIGDSIDVICPATIRMRDAKGDVLSICTSRIRADKLKLPTSTANPLDEDGPTPP